MDRTGQSARARRRSGRHRLIAGLAGAALACLAVVPVAAGNGSGNQPISGTILPTPVPPPTAPPTATPTPVPTPTPTPAPVLPTVTLTSLNPASGPVGSLITATGSGFNGSGYTVTSVTVDGSPSSFSVLSDTVLQFVVPSAPSGAVPVVVTTSDGTNTQTSGAVTFTVTTGTVPSSNPPPTITGIQPPNAGPGDSVTITSSDPFAGGGTTVTGVLVGGQSVDFTVNSPTSITFKVPDSLAAGPASIVVVLSDGTHSVMKAGLTLMIAAPPTKQGIVGGLFGWVAGVATNLPKPLVIGGGVLVFTLLALLVYLVIVAVTRRIARRNDEADADMLDFGKNVRF